MTPIQANKVHLRGQQACSHMQSMFYGHSYADEDYNQAAAEIDGAVAALFHAGEYGLISSLTKRISNILAPSEYVQRQPNIRHEQLIQHLQKYPIEPYAASPFLFGDPSINRLLAEATLRSASFSSGNASSWAEILTSFAKSGDIENWMTVSEGVFLCSLDDIQRNLAILTLGFFSEDQLDSHLDILSAHIQSLIDANETPLSFVRKESFERGTHPGIDAYTALKKIGHLDLTKEFLNRDIDDDGGPFKLQWMMKSFDWTPEESLLRTLARIGPNLKPNLAHSTAIYMLQLEELPERIEFYQRSLEELARVLGQDGSKHDFGVIKFVPDSVGAFIDSMVKASRVSNPYDSLIAAGVSEKHAMMSSQVRESRFSVDLGL